MTRTMMRKFGAPRTGAHTSRPLVWSAGLLLAALVALAAFVVADKTVEDDVRQRFDNITRSTQYAISARIKSYTDLVRGLVALFDTSDGVVTRSQFHRYVGGLDVPQHFPAIEALNYARFVSDGERDDFIASVRHDTSVDPAGYPG